ncbi:unnamed protein product [Chrysodeixis includens]|uniref:Uncharacterized protein n=1 Tax=Chrysodeixis includens TaxID=689277 RepID=A0A9N8L3K0_CHRIL|nr:unnamed protein product [Chrysodeixis includens]
MAVVVCLGQAGQAGQRAQAAGGLGARAHVLAALLVTAPKISHVAANSPTGGGGAHSPFFPALVLDALLRVIGGGIGGASSRCARRPARVCAGRACVRPALGAHCSISAAGTATPPDWAIHHRRPRARALHPAALRGAEPAPRARHSRPSAVGAGSRFPRLAPPAPPTR